MVSFKVVAPVANSGCFDSNLKICVIVQCWASCWQQKPFSKKFLEQLPDYDRINLAHV